MQMVMFKGGSCSAACTQVKPCFVQLLPYVFSLRPAGTNILCTLKIADTWGAQKKNVFRGVGWVKSVAELMFLEWLLQERVQNTAQQSAWGSHIYTIISVVLKETSSQKNVKYKSQTAQTFHKFSPQEALNTIQYIHHSKKNRCHWKTMIKPDKKSTTKRQIKMAAPAEERPQSLK